jgi:aryl-alcohol dehydrogenase-like predicted oxidoreductase
MEQTTIPGVPISASRIGLGTWAFGGYLWGGTDDYKSIATVRAALDQGVTLIDTAPAYGFGHSEEVVGRAIAEHGGRDRIVISTKAGLERQGDGIVRDASRAAILRGVDDSLARLRTDYIDLYFIHWPDPRVPIEETAQAMAEMLRTGKVRALGVSNYAPAQMDQFKAIAPISAAQPPYNIFERETAECEVFPWCKAHGVATLTYGALCRGLLAGLIDRSTKFKGDDLRNTDPKFKEPRFSQYLSAVALLQRYARDRYGKDLLPFAVRWALDRPGVSVALWGARRPDELAPLPDVFGWHLDEEAFRYVDEVLSTCVHDAVGPEFMAPPPRDAAPTAVTPGG